MRDGPETVSRYKSVTDTKPKLTCQVPGLAALLPTCHLNKIQNRARNWH